MRKELQRDDGLARLSRGTRWLTAGAFLSAGFLSVAVAETLPGRSSAALPTQPAQPSPLPSSSSSTGAEDPVVITPPTTAAQVPASPQTLSPPTTPPQTVYNPPVASSGGS